MTKHERMTISLQLQVLHRLMLREFYKDRESIEYKKALAKYTQTELLADILCPKNKTLAEYFGWTEEIKSENAEVINSWWKEQQELNTSIQEVMKMKRAINDADILIALLALISLDLAYLFLKFIVQQLANRSVYVGGNKNNSFNSIRGVL